MGGDLGRRATLAIACLALFAALGGSVYAAKRINGHTIKVKSLPGNRLAVGSVPGNRLRPGAIPGGRIKPGSVTGAQIDVSTLGRVPSASYATSAGAAGEAVTALHAQSADEATTVNGRVAGCDGGTRPFAGACWQVERNEAPVSATAAAAACAGQGGELPAALPLAAFAQQPGITLAVEGEWSGDFAVVSGKDIYALVTVNTAASIESATSAETRKYRCVLPLVR